MKTIHTREVETLRAEVRALQNEISRLEARLCAAPDAQDDDHEMRALWPYSWILSGVETVKSALEPKRKAPARRANPSDDEARFGRMMM